MASKLRPAALSLALIGALTGCTPPQGAPYMSQILAGADSPKADFAVLPVTSKELPVIAKWPKQPPVTPTVGWLPKGGGVNQDIVLAGDKLTIGMWSNEQNGLLTNPGEKFANIPPLTVDPGGSVILPYAGEVHVAGLTVEQARLAIQNALVKVMPTVQVALQHAAGRNNSVQVVTGLPQAGLVPLPDHDFTVLDLITGSGGIPTTMVNPEVEVSRGGKLYGIAFSKLVQDPSLNAVLHPGDRIFVVPEKRYFMAFGQTTKEAQVPFPDAKVSALDAMTMLGGLKQATANPKGVVVLRDYPASAVRKDGSGPPRQRMIFTFDLLSADGIFSAGRFQIQNKDLVMATQTPLSSNMVMANALAKLLIVPNSSINLIMNARRLSN